MKEYKVIDVSDETLIRDSNFPNEIKLRHGLDRMALTKINNQIITWCSNNSGLVNKCSIHFCMDVGMLFLDITHISDLFTKPICFGMEFYKSTTIKNRIEIRDENTNNLRYVFELDYLGTKKRRKS